MKNMHLTFKGIPNGALSFDDFIAQPVTQDLAVHAIEAADNPTGQISALLFFYQIADLKAQTCCMRLDQNDGTLDEGYIKLAYNYIGDNLGKILLQIGPTGLAKLVNLLTDATLAQTQK